MRKIFYISLLFMGMVAYAQQRKRVGINTNTPKETLDVNGTMRIDNVGEAKAGSIPLGWIPKTRDDASVYYGKVVKKSSENHTPMSYLTYKLNLENRNNATAREVNLKIDASKYTALLTQAYLVRSSFDFSSPSNHAAYVYAVAKKINENEIRIVKANGKGEFVNETGGNLISGEDENFQFQMGLVQPSIKLYTKEEGGKSYYFFSGDFIGSKPIVEYSPYSWILNIIIIEKPKSK